jgi:hypothetical protein
MSGVVSSGVEPPIEFGVKDCQVKGMIAGMSAEPSSSSLHTVLLDKACPVVIELGEYFHKVVRVQFTGLVIQVPPS